MANEINRAKIVINALSEGALTNEEALAIAEEYTNLAGQGAAPAFVAEEFLRILARGLSNQVRGNAERRKQLAIRSQISEAGEEAVSKLPDSIRVRPSRPAVARGPSRS